MRKVFISNLISLDNMIGRPNGDLDWFMADQEFFDYTATQVERRDTILFGRVTYEGMERYWTSKEAAESDPVITGQMNSTPKLVFSRTLDTVNWQNTTPIKGDLVAEITKLKQQPGKDIVIFGSSSIVSQLADAGLIDEYQLFLHPVVLGSGKPEFHGMAHKVDLKLVHAHAFKSGVMMLVYEPKPSV